MFALLLTLTQTLTLWGGCTQLWYKGHLRFRWPIAEGAMPVDGVHLVNSNHTDAPPYFGQQRMLGSHGGQRGYIQP